jgi:hypothetical protein
MLKKFFLGFVALLAVIGNLRADDTAAGASAAPAASGAKWGVLLEYPGSPRFTVVSARPQWAWFAGFGVKAEDHRFVAATGLRGRQNTGSAEEYVGARYKLTQLGTRLDVHAGASAHFTQAMANNFGAMTGQFGVGAAAHLDLELIVTPERDLALTWRAKTSYTYYDYRQGMDGMANEPYRTEMHYVADLGESLLGLSYYW